MTIIADGVADDTSAVMDAVNAGSLLPAGTIRITAPIISTATASQSPGIAIRGAPGFRTIILADYDEADYNRGGIIRLDIAGSGNYSYGSVIEDVVLKPAPNRAAMNGISLTAAWFTRMNRVMILGARHGVVTPFRPDINAISDFYQCFSLIMEQCFVRNCAGHGLNFSAGQSPGLYRVGYSYIFSNGGNGINSTAGQCEIDSNVISLNGYNGIAFDSNEGPTMVGSVTRNEIQDNAQCGISLLRSRDLEMVGNRFLSSTYSAAVGGSPKSGTPYMRQAIHVQLGNGGANEVFNLLVRRNLHRSVNGPSTTTAACVGYNASYGALSSAHPCAFEHNDFGASDGLSQNSTGFVKYSGSMPGAVIIDP